MYQKICCEEKHVNLLLTREESKIYYVLIKDFNTFKKTCCKEKHVNLLLTGEERKRY